MPYEFENNGYRFGSNRIIDEEKITLLKQNIAMRDFDFSPFVLYFKENEQFFLTTLEINKISYYASYGKNLNEFSSSRLVHLVVAMDKNECLTLIEKFIKITDNDICYVEERTRQTVEINAFKVLSKWAFKQIGEKSIDIIFENGKFFIIIAFACSKYDHERFSMKRGTFSFEESASNPELVED